MSLSIARLHTPLAHWLGSQSTNIVPWQGHHELPVTILGAHKPPAAAIVTRRVALFLQACHTWWGRAEAGQLDQLLSCP